MLPTGGMRTPRKNASFGKIQRYRMLLVGAGLLILAFVGGMYFGRTPNSHAAAAAELSHQQPAAKSPGPVAAHTLVIYIFSKTDTEYEDNLLFFLRWGVAANDGCDYVFILQQIEGVQASANCASCSLHAYQHKRQASACAPCPCMPPRCTAWLCCCDMLLSYMSHLDVAHANADARPDRQAAAKCAGGDAPQWLL